MHFPAAGMTALDSRKARPQAFQRLFDWPPLNKHALELPLSVFEGEHNVEGGHAALHCGRPRGVGNLLGLLHAPLRKLLFAHRSLPPKFHRIKRQLAESRRDKCGIEESEQIARLGPLLAVEKDAVDGLEGHRLLDGRKTRDLENLRLQGIVIPRSLWQRLREAVQEGPLGGSQFM